MRTTLNLIFILLFQYVGIAQQEKEVNYQLIGKSVFEKIVSVDGIVGDIYKFELNSIQKQKKEIEINYEYFYVSIDSTGKFVHNSTLEKVYVARKKRNKFIIKQVINPSQISPNIYSIIISNREKYFFISSGSSYKKYILKSFA